MDDQFDLVRWCWRSLVGKEDYLSVVGLVEFEGPVTTPLAPTAVLG